LAISSVKTSRVMALRVKVNSTICLESGKARIDRIAWMRRVTGKDQR